jgi:hypothetical protein
VIAVVCSSVLGAWTFAQERAPQKLPDAHVADSIARVKDLPASKLDECLPATRLADWLQAAGGPDAKINWAYVKAAADSHGHPDHVEAVATLNHDQTFFVAIALVPDVRHPSFESGWVIVSQVGDVELERLSDLPAAIDKLREKNQKLVPSEAQR